MASEILSWDRVRSLQAVMFSSQASYSAGDDGPRIWRHGASYGGGQFAHGEGIQSPDAATSSTPNDAIARIVAAMTERQSAMAKNKSKK